MNDGEGAVPARQLPGERAPEPGDRPAAQPGPDLAPETPPGLAPAHGWTLAVTATLVMAVSYVDRQTLAAIAPTVREALSLNATEYGWLTSAFSLAYLAVAPLSGALIDRVGSRIGLAAAVLLWSGVAGLHATVGSFATLFALRVALGVAEAPCFPGGAQVVRRALPPAQRSTGFGLLFTGSSIGATIAAPLAVALLNAYSWRFAFVGTAAAGLLWLPLWLTVSSSARARGALDARDAVSDPQAERWTRLLLDPAVLRAVVLVLASAPAIGFMLNWLPQFLVAEKHLTQAVLGRYVWMPMIFFDLGAVGFGAFASRREHALGPGSTHSHGDLVLAAAACCSVMALVPWVEGAWPSVFVSSISMAGGGGVYALLTGDMLARVSPSRVSMAGGMTAAAQSLAYVVANPLIGWSIDRTHAYSPALVTLGLTVLPGTAAWLMWPVRSARRT